MSYSAYSNGAPNGYKETNGVVSNVVTKTAPTTDGTDGVPVVGARAASIILDAGEGRTFVGTGKMVCDVWDPEVAMWAECAPATYDLSTTTDFAGKRVIAFPSVDFPMPPGGRVQWRPKDVAIIAADGSLMTTFIRLTTKHD